MPRPVTRDRSKQDESLSILRRSAMLAVGCIFWMLLIAARLYDLQVIDYVEWLGRAQRQQQRTIELAPQRGTIYDSSERPLAMSLPVDSIYAVPSHLDDPAHEAHLLAAALGLEVSDLEGRFGTSRSFCWVKRKVTSKESARVRALDLKGIYFQKEPKRFYPMKDLAANVIGYVGMDDQGLAGLEYSLNSELQGQPGHALVMEDALRRAFRSKSDLGQPGMNVELTIDAGIQYIAQSALDAAVQKWHAAGGVAIVQNPNTGDILAMVSEPTFDPNHFGESSANSRMDRAIEWIYEPGSVFKLVTVSSALQAGVAQPDDYIDCQMGAIRLGGRIIHDDPGVIPHDRAGPLTVRQVLAYSSDVGAVKLALRLGEDRFYNDIRKFGFGSKTDISLPGEERGLLMPPDRWSGVSIGEFAIGQGIGVTALQLVDAYSAIANGGMLLQPRIIKAIFRGETHEALPAQWRCRVVSPQTSATMRQMLQGVVAYGTGTAAQLDGYSSAGKTGTAEKVGPNGRYSHQNYVASFIGFAPVTHPALTILVSVDTPRGSIYGAEVAAPVWNEIAQQSLSYLNVPHDQPVVPLKLTAAEKQPAWQETSRTVSAVSASHLLELDPIGPSAEKESQTTQVLDTGPLVTVPDFSGLDERKVANECEVLGLELDLSGSGLAATQTPAPGTKLPQGSHVGVFFAR